MGRFQFPQAYGWQEPPWALVLCHPSTPQDSVPVLGGLREERCPVDWHIRSRAPGNAPSGPFTSSPLGAGARRCWKAQWWGGRGGGLWGPWGPQLPSGGGFAGSPWGRGALWLLLRSSEMCHRSLSLGLCRFCCPAASIPDSEAQLSADASYWTVHTAPQAQSSPGAECPLAPSHSSLVMAGED